MVTVAPQLELINKTEKLTMRFSSKLETTSYKNNSKLNALDHAHQGRIDVRLTPRLSYSANLDFKQDSRPDRDLQTSGLGLSSSKRQSLNGSLGAQYGITEKLNSLVNMMFGKEYFADPALIDSKTYGATAGFSYNLGTYLPRTTGRLILGHNRFEYPTNTVKSYSLSMGMSHDLTETYKLAADIGPRYTQSGFAATVNEEVGLGGTIALDYTGETTTISMALSREEQGVSGSAGTAERSSLSLSVSRKIYEELGCSLDLAYRNNSSKASIGSLKVEEDTFSLAPRIWYMVTKDINFEGNYSYTQLINRAVWAGDETRARNLVYVRLNYQYPLFD